MPEAAAGLLTMPNNQDPVERLTPMEKLQVLLTGFPSPPLLLRFYVSAKGSRSLVYSRVKADGISC